VFETPLVQQHSIQIWLDSKDPILVFLAEEYLNKEVPKEEELTEVLTFFNIFALGCNVMGNMELANIYSRRANLFASVLYKLGLRNKEHKMYVTNRKIPGTINRIIRQACSRAAFLFTDAKRDKEISNYDVKTESKKHILTKRRK
jgi:hypothetical protein